MKPQHASASVPFIVRGLLVALCVCASSIALACNVPVFRYALDHWRPDAFRAVVISAGQLTDTEQKSLDGLRENLKSKGSNLEIRQAQRADHSGAASLVLLYPTESGINQPVWQTVLSDDTARQLLDSPVRQQLVERLLAGQSTVWILVESSDAAQNQLAADALQSQLDSLAKTLELPKLTDDPDDKIVGGPELRIEFSMLRVSRSDDREQAFAAMLLAAEPDLVTLDEPMVFPVFGCGRAMLPLVGAGITPENIRETAVFLSGACSCQVKEQNPGFDLLISANWDALMPWTKSLSTNKLDPNAPPELIPIPSRPNLQPSPPSKPPALAAVSPANPPTPAAFANADSRLSAQNNVTPSNNEPVTRSPTRQLLDKSTIEPWLFVAGFAVALGALFILAAPRH